MPAEIHTGGLKKFVYSKSHKPKRDFETEKEIDRGYKQYYERKKREKRNKMIIILIILLIVVGGLAYFLLR